MSMAESKRKASADAGSPNKKIKSEHSKTGVHPDRQRYQKGGKPNGFKKEDKDGKETFLNGTHDSSPLPYNMLWRTSI